MNTPGDKKQPGGSGRKWGIEVGPLLTLGLQLGISVAVFFGLGYLADVRFGTAPWCALAGAVIGIAGGLIKFLREATALGRKADENYRASRKVKSED